MKKKITNSTSKYIKARQRKKIWRNTVSCLVALVLFCTSYMLVRPAATMDPSCNKLEHIHEEGCYDENGNVICPFLEHIHSAECAAKLEEDQTAMIDSSIEEVMIDTAGDETPEDRTGEINQEDMETEGPSDLPDDSNVADSEDEMSSESDTTQDEETEKEYLFENFPYTKDEILNIVDGPQVLIDVEWNPEAEFLERKEEVEIPQRISRKQTLNADNSTENEDAAALDSVIEDNGELSLNEPVPLAESQNIRDYLNGIDGAYFEIKLTDADNVEIKPGPDDKYEVYTRTDYKLVLGLGSTKGIDPGSYTYQLPIGVKVKAEKGDLLTNDGVKIGDWNVTDDGLITFNFNDKANAATGFKMSMSMIVRFSGDDTEIDFDGDISIKVEEPVDLRLKTQVNKWSSKRWDEASKQTKIRWRITVDGGRDSQLVDQYLTDDLVSRNSYLSAADRNSFGLTVMEYDPDTKTEIWHRVVDNARNVEFFDEKGNPLSPQDFDNEDVIAVKWRYKIPKSLYCEHCKKNIDLGNENWHYEISYDSTPYFANEDQMSVTVQNDVEIDDVRATHKDTVTRLPGQEPIIEKTGKFNGDNFTDDNPESTFDWHIQVYIPPKLEGQPATMDWNFVDGLAVVDNKVQYQPLPEWIKSEWIDTGLFAQRIKESKFLYYPKNPVENPDQTALNVPYVDNATENDQFAWILLGLWINENNTVIGFNYSLLTRCVCEQGGDTCQLGNHDTFEGKSYRYKGLDGTEFCHCWNWSEDAFFDITYNLPADHFVEDYGGQSKYLANGITVQYKIWDNAHKTPIDVNGKYDEDAVPVPGIFNKTELKMDELKDKKVKFEIKVNEAKIPLSPTQSEITVKDIMSETLVYYSGSLTVEAEDLDGNKKILTEGTDYTIRYNANGEVDGKKVHILEIVILHPERAMYTIRYDTLIDKPNEDDTSIHYSNKAEVTLWDKNLTDDTGEKLANDWVATAEINKVGIYKVDATNSKPLQGAEFGLFDANNIMIDHAVTDSNGKLTFQTAKDKGVVILSHDPYYIKEIKAPDGYMCSDAKHWIVFCAEPQDQCTYNPAEDGITDTNFQYQVIRSSIDLVEIPLSNTRAYQLPETGGKGVVPMAIGGAALISVSAAALAVMRRKRKED